MNNALSRKPKLQIATLLLLFCFLLSGCSKAEPTTVVTVSALQKIISISELSTYTAVYNGIAEVRNEKKPEKVDYYVSYEAKVTAGIDIEKIDISIDHSAKTITVKLPDVYVTGITVDMKSLDFIFINNKANATAVTVEAYRACEADVAEESVKYTSILEMARENAINIVTALIKPIADEMEEPYALVFSEEDLT